MGQADSLGVQSNDEQSNSEQENLDLVQAAAGELRASVEAAHSHGSDESQASDGTASAEFPGFLAQRLTYKHWDTRLAPKADDMSNSGDDTGAHENDSVHAQMRTCTKAFCARMRTCDNDIMR